MQQEALDEREALAAIYGDKVRFEDRPGGGFVVRVLLDVEELRDAVELRFTVAHDYPSSSTPEWALDDTFQLLTHDTLQALEAKFDEAADACRGSVVLFAWIECLREILLIVGDHIAEQQRVMLAAQEANAAASHFVDDTDTHASEPDEHPPRAHPPAKPRDSVPLPQIYHGGLLEDRKSVFQAHLAAVSTAREAEAVREALLQDRKIARATHNIMAYRIVSSAGVVQHDNDDDGEDAAGGRLAHLLELIGATNVIVVVSRWYGGIQLGPDRFRHINNVARELLDAHGYVQKRGGKGQKR